MTNFYFFFAYYDSALPYKQILVFAVEVMEFLWIFECEARLMVCEHSKIHKSTQNAPKDEFFYFCAIFSITALNALLGRIMPLHLSSFSL